VLFAGYQSTEVTLQQPCWTNSQLANTVWKWQHVASIENARELLDSPGEWYLDAAAGYIYYLPRPGEDLQTAKVMAPVLETLVSGSGTGGGTTTPTFLHNVQFKGLTFAFATWNDPSTANGYVEYQGGNHLVGVSRQLIPAAANVTFSTAKAIDIENDIFTHLGGVALNLDRMSQSNVVRGNAFSDVSSSAIHIGDVDLPAPAAGQTEAQLPAVQCNVANVVQDNFIDGVAVEYPSGVGVFFGHSDTGTIAHNEVGHVPYSGISVGWGWDPDCSDSYAQKNTVTDNYVHDVMTQLRDGGGIYTLSCQPGSGLTGNYITTVQDSGNAIYHDQGSRYFTDHDNVVANAGYWLSMWEPDITNNTLQNNYVDYDVAYCVRQAGPSSAICNFGSGADQNVVNQNTFTNGGAWPAAAQAIIGAAGLEPAYVGIKAPVCGDATCNNGETAVTCPKDCR
jgi:hypothetical protein